MKIYNEYSTYTKQLQPGLYAYFIELSGKGYEPNIDILSQTIANFPNCVIYGEEPMKYKSDIAVICRSVQKTNPETTVIVWTNGYQYPAGLTSLKNIEYVVELPLKSSGVNYHDRINEKPLQWHAKNDSKFVIRARSDDEFDEIDMLKSDIGFKNSQLYIDLQDCDDYDKFQRKCFHKGYNIFIEVGAGLLDE